MGSVYNLSMKYIWIKIKIPFYQRSFLELFIIILSYRLEHFFREAYALTFGLKPGEKRKFEEVTSDVIMVMRTTLSKKEFASALGMKEGDLFIFWLQVAP